jgi:hypothetical protein
MSLVLRLPGFSERPAQAPEIRPWRVALVIGEALSATNRVSMSHARRLDLAEQYWKTAALLWPRLEHRFIRASHPLQGDDLEAAKAALALANELSLAYKRLLVSESSRRFVWGGPRRALGESRQSKHERHAM